MEKKIDKNHFRGCLLGGAIGDAHGYGGLENGKWLISDNTQLTSFTVDGLVWADEKAERRGIYAYIPCVFYSYQKWYYTQTNSLADERYDFILRGEILKWEELFARRGQGTTTLNALRESIHGSFGTFKNKLNRSDFCGAVMRSAPIGMYFCENEEEAFRFGAEAAALTHGGDSAILAPAFFAHMTALILQGHDPKTAAVKSLARLDGETYGFSNKALHGAIKNAILLAEKEEPRTALPKIGKGNKADEAMAAAVYLAIKYGDDFGEALSIISSYDGNVDSIGSIAGNLIGANVGMLELPFDLIAHTELSDLIVYGSDKLLKRVTKDK